MSPGASGLSWLNFSASAWISSGRVVRYEIVWINPIATSFESREQQATGSRCHRSRRERAVASGAPGCDVPSTRPHSGGMPKGGRSILTTLLFTDIVGSTRLAEEMGDRRWRELLARHHRLIRIELKRHEGRELDTAGDGFFARFDTPASAIRCACAASDAVRALGIEIRAGVHIGECEILDGKVSGVNVHIGARTMAEARGGQVLVTGGVRDMVKGAGFGFADSEMHELKGVEGEWHLFEVTSVDDSPRPPAAPEEEARARRDTIEPPPLVKRKGVRIAAMTMALAVVV